MATGFQRTDAGRIVIRLEELECAILRSLTDQVADLLAPAPGDPDADPLHALVGIEAQAARPEDPVLARLLPDAYRDDEPAADDFRRFTERSLRETKIAHAQTVRAALDRSGEKITLSPEECASWLGFLNDVRLAIGTRIGIEEDNHEMLAALPDDDPRGGLFQLYDWLTYLQETLVQVLLP